MFVAHQGEALSACTLGRGEGHRAAYCVPLIVPKNFAYNVHTTPTPDMAELGIPAGYDYQMRPLHENRDVWIVRLADDEKLHAIMPYVSLLGLLEKRVADLQQNEPTSDATLEWMAEMSFWLRAQDRTDHADQLLQDVLARNEKRSTRHPRTDAWTSELKNAKLFGLDSMLSDIGGRLAGRAGAGNTSSACAALAVSGSKVETAEVISSSHEASDLAKGSDKFVHFGILCDGPCKANPIVGARFQSEVRENFDLCEECFVKALEHGEAEKDFLRIDDTWAGVRMMGPAGDASVHAALRTGFHIEPFRARWRETEKEGKKTYQEHFDLCAGLGVAGCGSLLLAHRSLLGNALIMQGRLTDARHEYEDILSKQRKALGPRHPDTNDTMDMLGRVLVRLGHLSDAEACYRESLQSRRERLGEWHADTLGTKYGLVQILVSPCIQQFKEAEALCEDIIRGHESHGNTSDAAAVKLMLAEVQQAQP